MNKPRRQIPDPDKVSILKKHLLDKVPISDLCDEYDLYPNQIYDWLKKFFENGHLALANSRSNRQAKVAEDVQLKKVEQLQAKLQRKDSVLAELMEEHVALKKTLGEV